MHRPGEIQPLGETLAGIVGIAADRIRQWGRVFRRPITYSVLLRTRPRQDPLPPNLAACESLDWLLAAHAAAQGRAFASLFSLSHGWGPPYPETSGYLVPTLLMARGLGHRGEELREAVARTGEWLLEIQQPDGSFCAPSDGQPMVFDTGQVLFGLLALSDGSDGEERYLQSAYRAGEWILGRQDPRGYWVRSAYRGIPHTYYTRVSWALLMLSRRTGEPRFREAAHRQLLWAKEQQTESGWFSNCSFHPDEKPVLHVIAYTIRGLWESSLLLDDRDLERSAVTAAEALRRIEEEKGRLASRFGPGWAGLGRDACVTGLCQMAGIWLRMARRAGRPDFAKAAKRCLVPVFRCQVRHPRRPEVHGGLPGSIPLWGSYFPWTFPNWGAKFLIDAVLLTELSEKRADVPG